MNRNLTPRPVRATGAREAHGRILDPESGQLYVHMHRERGLSHRHYVLHGWQVRVLNILLSWPMRVLYVVALVTWGWMASQAARVPVLLLEVNTLRRDAERLDTLTSTLAELQARYDQVQRMMGGAEAAKSAGSASTSTAPAGAGTASSAGATGASSATPTQTKAPTKTGPIEKSAPKADSTKKPDSTRAASDTIKPPV